MTASATASSRTISRSDLLFYLWANVVMSEKLANFAIRRNDNNLKMASPTIGRLE